MAYVTIDGSNLTIDQVIAVARNNAPVRIDQSALTRMSRTRRILERLLQDNRLVYGVNTGFGALSNVKIAKEQLPSLQSNLIRSHATSVGKPHSTDVVRAIMLLRANTLLKGNSGIRPEIPLLIVALLNERIHPIVPQKGSVGASGDLSPLSHIGLLLIGEGPAEYRGRPISGSSALRAAGQTPLQLEAKEGLAINNGTQQIVGIGSLCLQDSYSLLLTEEAALSLSLEGINGWIDAFDERIHKLRPHPGQGNIANHVRRLLVGSRLVRSLTEGRSIEGHPQDPYSFRCAPQVMGASKDLLDFARNTLEIEMNSATDNPLLFPRDRVCLSGGNFHGQPVAVALDMICLAISTMANICERRISAMLDPALNNGLPAFLVGKQSKPGLSSGLMAVQYTAASLVAESKLLTHPASSDSIPTSSNFEDFVSMGPGAAHKACSVLENSQYVVSIELLTACQAIDLRGPQKQGKGTRKIYEAIRRVVPPLSNDRPSHADIERITTIVKEGKIAEIVSTVTG